MRKYLVSSHPIEISQQSKEVLEITHKLTFAIFGRYDTYACDNLKIDPIKVNLDRPQSKFNFVPLLISFSSNTNSISNP